VLAAKYRRVSMETLQQGIDFVMRNKAFFAFLIASVGYIIAKYRASQKDKKISRLRAALKAIAESIEEFSRLLEMKDERVFQDPKSLKKTIAYKVSKGREELDEILRETEGTFRSVSQAAGRFSRLLKVFRRILP